MIKFSPCPICGLANSCVHSEEKQVEFLKAQNRAVNKIFKEAGIPTVESLSEELAAMIIQRDKWMEEVCGLRGLVREMGARLNRFTAYGNVFGYRDWESSPFDDAKEILSRPQVKAMMEEW